MESAFRAVIISLGSVGRFPAPYFLTETSIPNQAINPSTPDVSSGVEIAYASTFARGAAIAAVVALHVTAGQIGAHSGELNLQISSAVVVNALSRFAVPLFFLLSAYSLALKGTPAHPTRFLRRKAGEILLPYLLWSLLYQALFALIAGREFSPGLSLRQLLTGTSAAHLWFIHSIALLTLAHPALYAFYRAHLRSRPGRILALGLIQLLWNAALSTAVDPVRGIPPQWLILLDNELFKHWWLFLAGYELAFRQAETASFLRRKGVILGIIVLYCIMAFLQAFVWLKGIAAHGALDLTPGHYRIVYLLEPFSGLAGLALLAAIYRRSPGTLQRMFAAFGLYSFGIYFVHPIVIAGLKKAAPAGGIGFDSPAYFPLIFVGGIIISYLFAKVAAKFS